MSPGRPQLVWLGVRGSDALTFEGLGDLRAVVCCDFGAGHASLAQRIPVVSLEREQGQRRAWSMREMAQHDSAGIAARIDALAAREERDLVVLPYQRNAWVDATLARLRSRPHATGAPAGLVARLQDKHAQRDLFRRAGIPTPESVRVRAGDLAQGCVPATPGFPAVLQVPIGSRGEGVHPIDGPDAAVRIARGWPPELEALLSRRIDGVSLNIAGVVGRERVWVGWPSIQVLAAEGCCDADWPFAYCGNDYAASADLPTAALERLFARIETLGAALRAEGWLGAFGVDLIHDGSDFFLLEVNMRFQGSTALQSRLERAAGTPPLIAAHLATFLPAELAPALLPPNRPDRPLCGAQVILYQSDPAPRRVGAGRGAAAIDAPGWGWRDEPAGRIEAWPRAALGRWWSPQRALDAARTALGDEARRAVADARRRLGYEEDPADRIPPSTAGCSHA